MAAGRAPSGTDRAARRAVTVFPVLVLAAGAVGLAAPDAFAGWKPGVPYLLGVVMFCSPLTLLLAGEYLPVDTGSMVTDILKTVLLPVVAGLLVRLFLGRYVDRALGALPWLSAATIAVIVAVVVAGSAAAIKSAAALVLLAVVLHNGASLATAHFGPLAALPAAVFSVWHNVSGSLVAAWMAHRHRNSPTDSDLSSPSGD
ncbi:Sodium Bile acid symporter family protein [Streptomyces sp. YIM 121038]|uniref:hypothetical protein n=1 Tax=Streptomyces sp. YIM 121038 TaxID=2136401 RepID=UPI001165312D|nr:hypothetical protein [Streptomyces sp. YIM 121038]QCX75336.1 Sodium Bile acid symporter family protein [Streptomyces sp. YIM 121038]